MLAHIVVPAGVLVCVYLWLRVVCNQKNNPNPPHNGIADSGQCNADVCVDGDSLSIPAGNLTKHVRTPMSSKAPEVLEMASRLQYCRSPDVLCPPHQPVFANNPRSPDNRITITFQPTCDLTTGRATPLRAAAC
jgi:hypothetical protein